MSKCGKGCMPECEYFTTGGCISPFNCMYRIEELSPSSATSVSSSYVQNLISENAALKSENAELRATLSKMETVEKELRERLEKAVELPCIEPMTTWDWDDTTGLGKNNFGKYWQVLYRDKDGEFIAYIGATKEEAEARLAELKGGEQ